MLRNGALTSFLSNAHRQIKNIILNLDSYQGCDSLAADQIALTSLGYGDPQLFGTRRTTISRAILIKPLLELLSNALNLHGRRRLVVLMLPSPSRRKCDASQAQVRDYWWPARHYSRERRRQYMNSYYLPETKKIQSSQT